MNKKTQLLAIRILGSLAFLSIPIITYPNFDEFDNPFFDDRFPKVMFKQILLITFFYINYYYFLPKFYFKKKLIALFAVIMLSLTFILIIGDNFMPKLPRNNELPRRELENKIKNNDQKKRPSGVQLNRTEYTIIQFCFIFVISILFKNTKRLEELNEERIKTELSYLKAQINPHFLFNTLNSLYALTLQKSDKAPNAVLKLSGLMRYVVTESAQEFVNLEKEINYLNDYIDLQKLRMDNNTKFSYQVKGNFLGQIITPLILIPFVENAFKYGINPEENGDINIKIDMKDNNLELYVSNKIVIKSVVNEALKSEKGIASSIKRLKFIYANKHSLVLNNNGVFYTVLLKIQLQ